MRRRSGEESFFCRKQMKPVDRSTRPTACAIGFFLVFSLLSAICPVPFGHGAIGCSPSSKKNCERWSLPITPTTFLLSAVMTKGWLLLRSTTTVDRTKTRGRPSISWRFTMRKRDGSLLREARRLRTSSGQLERIPDSPFFTFEGTVSSGLIIRSPQNSLSLRIGRYKSIFPKRRAWRNTASGQQKQRSNGGKDRSMAGWFTSTSLCRTITAWRRSISAGSKIFTGSMLPCRMSAISIFTRRKVPSSYPWSNNRRDFSFSTGKGHRVSSLQVKARSRSFTAGFYRWPKSWTGSFQAGKEHYEFECNLSERKTIANWVIGGFAMGIVKGRLVTPNGTLELYGLGELIM